MSPLFQFNPADCSDLSTKLHSETSRLVWMYNDANGEIVYVIAVETDITEVKFSDGEPISQRFWKIKKRDVSTVLGQEIFERKMKVYNASGVGL